MEAGKPAVVETLLGHGATVHIKGKNTSIISVNLHFKLHFSCFIPYCTQFHGKCHDMKHGQSLPL